MNSTTVNADVLFIPYYLSGGSVSFLTDIDEYRYISSSGDGRKFFAVRVPKPEGEKVDEVVEFQNRSQHWVLTDKEIEWSYVIDRCYRSFYQSVKGILSSWEDWPKRIVKREELESKIGKSISETGFLDVSSFGFHEAGAPSASFVQTDELKGWFEFLMRSDYRNAVVAKGKDSVMLLCNVHNETVGLMSWFKYLHSGSLFPYSR